MDGVSTFSRHLSSFLCEIAYSNRLKGGSGDFYHHFMEILFCKL